MRNEEYQKIQKDNVDIYIYRTDTFIYIYKKVSVLPQCYRSSTLKIPVILPKVQVAGYSQTRMYLAYVALHEVTWCMVVWFTQNVPRWQQFHVAPAMPAL